MGAVVEVPEWDSVWQAVQAALAAQPDALDRLSRCPAIAIYTDGSAPLENPGGPAGSAAIVLGFDRPADPSALRRPPVVVQLDIGAYPGFSRGVSLLKPAGQRL